jgi:surfactin synthase thioesterase subunit
VLDLAAGGTLHRTMVTESAIRRVALELPEAFEQPSHHGRPSWRTKQRMFAWLRDDPEALVVWVDSLDEKEAKLAREPRVFFTTPHYDGHPMLLVRPEKIDERRAKELITESWKIRATRAQRKRLERTAERKAFVLLPGAGGTAYYWHRVVPLLEKAGNEALAVELPADDDKKGLRAYADLVVAAIGKRDNVTLVAQSMGGFTAALVCARAPQKIQELVFVNAMIPLPGETAGAWWNNTDSEKARKSAARRAGYSPEFDLHTYFLHDLPKREAKLLASHERDESPIAFREPARFKAWPKIPIHVIVGKDDRFFPRTFQARVARERLGVGVDEVPGGHLVALSRPRELARMLLDYAAE